MSPAASTAPRPHESVDDYRRLPLHRLQCGQTLEFPIRAADGLLLLAEGSLLTPRLLEILEQRGHTAVWVHRREPALASSLEPTGALTSVPNDAPSAVVGVHNRATRILDYELRDRIAEAAALRAPPFRAEIPNLGPVPYSDSLAREIFQKHESFVDELRESALQIVQSDPRGGERAGRVVHEYLRLLIEDIDLFAHCASSPYGGGYPHRHSLHVAMLGLAMGVRAGLGEEQLHLLGLGSLLHDVGMLRIPKSAWGSRSTLTAQQRLAVMAHPIYSVEALSRTESTPVDVRYIAYQVHERSGGQGYPRRVPSDLIHPLAKIVMTADMYVAMLSDRPHRPAVQPYAAVECLVRAVRAGRLDAQPVRWLLETVSLYPIGSYVLLSNGRLGKILRSNGSAYDRPVVRTWPPRSQPSDRSGELVDLSKTEELTVVEALPSPLASG